MSDDKVIRCVWCGKSQTAMSRWEQKTLTGEWRPLCSSCANRRLRNPYNGILPMRKTVTEP